MFLYLLIKVQRTAYRPYANAVSSETFEFVEHSNAMRNEMRNPVRILEESTSVNLFFISFVVLWSSS